MPDSFRAAWAAKSERWESPSSIVSFLECPLQWFAKRHAFKLYEETGDTVLGITEPLWDPPNKWAVGGTLAHRALEVFYSEPAHLRGEDLLEDVFDHAWSCLRQGDVKDGIITKSILKDFEQMLEGETGNRAAFLSQFRRQYRDITLADFDIEDPEQIDVEANESSIFLSRGTLRVRGKIDRVDRTLRGERIVVDYKTGKSPGGDVNVFNLKFLPAGIYALAMEEEPTTSVARRPVAGVRLLYLASAERYNIKVTDDMLMDVEDIVGMVNSEMLAIAERGTIPVAPADAADQMPCKYCPIRATCPVWN